MGQHLELLFPVDLHHAPLRRHLDRHERGVGLFAVDHAFADPPDQPLVALRAGIESLTAAVRDDVRGLQEQQALLRGRREHPPAVPLLHDVLVILLRLEAEQRQSKTILPVPRLRMAAARITRGLGQDRHDVIHEIQGSCACSCASAGSAKAALRAMV